MDSQSLCLSCGLCCDGSIHGHLVLLERELAAVKAAEILIIEHSGSKAFALPCPHLDGLACTIYQARYNSCRVYRCANLEAAENGAIDPDEALRRITLARSALAALIAVLPPGETISDARTRRSRRSANGPTDPLDGKIAVLLTALDRVLDRYFRFGRDRVIDREAPPRA